MLYKDEIYKYVNYYNDTINEIIKNKSNEIQNINAKQVKMADDKYEKQ